MSCRRALQYLLAASLPAFTTLQAAAQAITPAECEAQIAALNSGTRDMQGWERIGECASTAGPAVASKLRAARTETDSLYLQVLLTAAVRMQEPNVWQAGVDLADNAGATVSARVVGLLVQLGQYSGRLSPFGSRSWQDVVGVPASECGFDINNRPRYRSKVPLPSNAFNVSASHLDALAASASTPAVVRKLASCVREAMEPTIPQTVDPALILLDYVCGHRYRVRNTSTKWVDVTFQLFHGNERGTFPVAAGGNVTFTTIDPYGLALYYNSQLIREAQNGGTTCPP